jgi:hypothetical protein
MKKIIANIEEIQGRFYDAYYELEVSDEELENFDTLSEEEKEEYIQSNGKLILDTDGDYDIDDIGDISDIVIEE